MSGNSDFVIENGVLVKYNGPGGDVVIPEGGDGSWIHSVYMEGRIDKYCVSGKCNQHR